MFIGRLSAILDRPVKPDDDGDSVAAVALIL
jgi:hypothetical protein